MPYISRQMIADNRPQTPIGPEAFITKDPLSLNPQPTSIISSFCSNLVLCKVLNKDIF